MQPRVDLRLVYASLKQLRATPYFDKGLQTFSDELCAAIDFALAASPALPDIVLTKISHVSWHAHEYLAGSISREVPYELKYCLSMALDDWKRQDCLITTSLVYNRAGFHFLPVDPWHIIKNTLPGYVSPFSSILILIGVPKLYKHKPVFCTPLYHELGHFIDFHRGVVNHIQIRMIKEAALRGVSVSHWREFFCDLFAASYVGRSSVLPLEIIDPGAGASLHHPANADRIALVDAFLSNKPDWRIDAFRTTLAALAAPQLIVRHNVPSVAASFDDLRPYSIKNAAEVHGSFEATWEYYSAATKAGTLPWAPGRLSESEIEQAVNDLLEKSIRNFKITSDWTT